MSLKEKESLSALMDGETDELELRRLLKQISEGQDSTELRSVWDRFNLVRSVLHGEDVKATPTDLSQRIMAIIANEPAFDLAAEVDSANVVIKPVPGSWMQPLVKFAVAASFAAAFILVVQPLINDPQSGQSVVQENDRAEAVLTADNVSPVFDPAAQQRLDDYINTVALDYRNGSLIDPLYPPSQIRQVNKERFEFNFKK